MVQDLVILTVHFTFAFLSASFADKTHLGGGRFQIVLESVGEAL